MAPEAEADVTSAPQKEEKDAVREEDQAAADVSDKAPSSAPRKNAEARPAPRLPPLSMEQEEQAPRDGRPARSGICARRRTADGEPIGLGQAVAGALGGLGAAIVDNMSFVGEVFVDFLELDKPRYHHEITQIQKQQRAVQQAREAREAAEIERVEAPADQ
eukprot:TRINITY_DN12412_c0_g1_i1.p1 TRINITY_DN12412_c0_g1~~TRINITY_DN12412_c0_g1_i1.p1  ORF type:complete len:161 (+),score=48.07 TRINITY_DN12412_c0_g1_i1:89-571(+)